MQKVRSVGCTKPQNICQTFTLCYEWVCGESYFSVSSSGILDFQIIKSDKKQLLVLWEAVKLPNECFIIMIKGASTFFYILFFWGTYVKKVVIFFLPHIFIVMVWFKSVFLNTFEFILRWKSRQYVLKNQCNYRSELTDPFAAPPWVITALSNNKTVPFSFLQSLFLARTH